MTKSFIIFLFTIILGVFLSLGLILVGSQIVYLQLTPPQQHLPSISKAHNSTSKANISSSSKFLVKDSPIASSTSAPKTTNLPTSKPASNSQITSINISETDLWQALIDYRLAHTRTSLVLEEPLCIYARSRVVEHQERLKNLSQDESPLDNHSGFQRDADNKTIFEQTGFTTVAEVLAFLPSAQNATQVIEWGWDSSPAHREGLLSNDVTHACIVGTAPFYVGILAKR